MRAYDHTEHHLEDLKMVRRDACEATQALTRRFERRTTPSAVRTNPVFELLEVLASARQPGEFQQPHDLHHLRDPRGVLC